MQTVLRGQEMKRPEFQAPAERGGVMSASRDPWRCNGSSTTRLTTCLQVWGRLDAQASENGAAPECKGGGNCRSPIKPADQRHRHARFLHAKYPVVTRPGFEPESGVWISAGMNERGKREIPEKKKRPARSRQCENPRAVLPRNKPGSTRRGDGGRQLTEPLHHRGHGCVLIPPFPRPSITETVLRLDWSRDTDTVALTNGIRTLSLKCNTRKGGVKTPSFLLILDRRAAPECKGRGEREAPEKTHRPAASPGTIPACKNPGATPPRIEPGSLRWEASSLTTLPPRPQLAEIIVHNGLVKTFYARKKIASPLARTFRPTAGRAQNAMRGRSGLRQRSVPPPPNTHKQLTPAKPTPLFIPWQPHALTTPTLDVRRPQNQLIAPQSAIKGVGLVRRKKQPRAARLSTFIIGRQSINRAGDWPLFHTAGTSSPGPGQALCVDSKWPSAHFTPAARSRRHTTPCWLVVFAHITPNVAQSSRFELRKLSSLGTAAAQVNAVHDKSRFARSGRFPAPRDSLRENDDEPEHSFSDSRTKPNPLKVGSARVETGLSRRLAFVNRHSLLWPSSAVASTGGMKGWGNRISPRKPADLGGIVRHDSHMQKSGDPAGDRTQFALVGGEQANRSATAAPFL
ncbi:hypothetical protein PR048_029086 [Dryococelus australis]|uniref:Uncharacterized protein n=1 Tax=Dryococelus australis TaxID=614101 RepID=A0ABQ9GCD6_9NEOP|nr:hypothetical protein PR048_029086 [Dryococelus australis]